MGRADRSGLTIDSAAIAAFGQAAQAIGHGEFYGLLMEAFGLCLPHDMSAVMRYSPFSQPDFLFGSDYSADFSIAYTQDFYRYDPYYRYWKEVEQPGVVPLRQVVTTEADRNRYVNTILAGARVTDEIALFLPPVGRSSIALFIDLCGERYTQDHVETARAAYDLIAGLHGAHLNCITGNVDAEGVGTALAGSRPTRIIDRGNNEILHNRAWSAFAARSPDALAQALAALGTVPQATLGPDLILHRAALPATFDLAPGGSIDTIEPIGLAPVAPHQFSIPTGLTEALSRREQDILELMLQGFPTKKIAVQLRLTPGTIKNYRRRIYDKLDITTEREIFVRLIEAMRER